MARTHRDKLHVIRRERFAAFDDMPVGAFPDQHGWADIRNFQKLKGGDMIMSQSTSGVWDDCRASDSAGRKRQRRAIKRRERQSWMRRELTAEGGGNEG